MLAWSWVLALALHAAVLIGLLREPQSAPFPRADEDRVLAIDHEVELEVPEPPPPPNPPRTAPDEPNEPRPAALAAPDRVTPDARTDLPDQPPPPARAGQVVARDSMVQPLDFTGFDMATGNGALYVGGVTASSGTHVRPVRGTAASSPLPSRPSGERAVTLAARSWSCPWPREAEALGIDEQVVVLRAVVDRHGRPSTVELLADPGHGFGQAAVVCARKARFEPARDSRGVTHTATSPPIRVIFRR